MQLKDTVLEGQYCFFSSLCTSLCRRQLYQQAVSITQLRYNSVIFLKFGPVVIKRYFLSTFPAALYSAVQNHLCNFSSKKHFLEIF